MNDTDDWYDVSELDDGIHRITELSDYGSFLIEGSQRALLIDTGIGIGDLSGLVTGMVDTPITVLLTHSHWDHIGNVHQFDDVVVHDLERSRSGAVSIDVLSDEFVHRPRELIGELRRDDAELPSGFDPDQFGASPPTQTDPMTDGRVIDLGSKALECYHVPGHSPGQTAVLDRDSRVLFGADVVHKEKNLYLHFEDSDLTAYLNSLDRIRNLRDVGAFDVLATSHNAPLAGDELAIIDDLIAGLDDVRADTVPYEIIETSWGDARKYVIGDTTVLTKPDLS